MAAGTCLSLLAQAVADTIVPAVIPFIEANIKAQDWHQREAAVMTFGSILDGPDPQVLNPLVAQALPILIDMMSDESVHVKDTTAWTLGRICDLLIQTIKPDVHLHPLVSAFVSGLDDSPRIISNCCWGLMNLADQLGVCFGDDEPIQQDSPLTMYFEGIVNALVHVTEKYVVCMLVYTITKLPFRPSNESNFRTSAYEALASYVSHSAQSSLPTVSNVIITILNRMEQLLAMQARPLFIK